jgi:hypothetical protein
MATRNTVEDQLSSGMSSGSPGTSGVMSATSPRFDALDVKVFRRDAASSYGWWGNLAVVLGRQPPDAVHVANYRACVIELHKQHPQGVGLITVVNDASTPSAAGRDAMIKMFKEIWPLMRASLFVPNADGFKAAVLRSVMGGLILATGQRDRVRVERSLSLGLPWFLNKVLGEDEAHRQIKHLQWGIEKFCEVESEREVPSLR